MNQVARTFILVGLVVVILFAMRFLPTIYLGDNELRQVNILSDLLPETLSGTDSPICCGVGSRYRRGVRFH